VIFRFGSALLWTLAILTVCWLPRRWVEVVEGERPWLQIPALDKVIHWFIFVGFSVLWLRLGQSRRRIAWIVVAGIALSAITELVQNLPVVGRDGSVGDFLMDLTGIAVGLAVAGFVEPKLRHVESCIFREARR
jgi:hypothetical protein